MYNMLARGPSEYNSLLYISPVVRRMTPKDIVEIFQEGHIPFYYLRNEGLYFVILRLPKVRDFEKVIGKQPPHLRLPTSEEVNKYLQYCKEYLEGSFEYLGWKPEHTDILTASTTGYNERYEYDKV